MLRLSGLTVATLAVAAGFAAMPAYALPQAAVASGVRAGNVTPVADRCGRFRHFSVVLGRCVRNVNGTP